MEGRELQWEAYLEVVPSGLVHLQKEKSCKGMYPRGRPPEEELGQGGL